MTGTDQTSDAAYRAWTEHRFFAYRGCAPDPDSPKRAAGDSSLSLDAWHGADRDGAEPQKERRAREQAAIEVCLSCSVMVECDVYANTVVVEGEVARLAEPDGIRGGRTALERHRAFIAHRHEVASAAPDARLRTKQKLAVLRALALFSDPYDVARWAGVDVRTANWQRSNLVTLLGLARGASRGELLAVAAERGLLGGVTVVADDGSVPAVPPPTKMSAVPEPVHVVEASDVAPVVASGVEPPVVESTAEVDGERPGGPIRLQAPRRDRFTDIAGQLALWETELSELADVHTLFPTARLEAAA